MTGFLEWNPLQPALVFYYKGSRTPPLAKITHKDLLTPVDDHAVVQIRLEH